MIEQAGQDHVEKLRLPRRGLIRGCAALVATAGIVALLGWGFGLPVLASLGEGKIPMAPSTALLFVLYGYTAFHRTRIPMSPGAYWACLLINTVGALAAAILLLLSSQGIYPDAELLGFAGVDRLGEIPVGHMSPVTALAFLLASLSFLLSLRTCGERSWRSTVARWLAGVPAATGSVLLLAYLYGNPLSYFGAYIPPAATTSAAFVALGIALLALAVPRTRQRSRQGEPAFRNSLAFAAVFALLSAGIIAAGYFYTRNYERHYRSEVERELTSIAELKVSELDQWRNDRLADAAVSFKNPAFSALVRRYLEAPEDAQAHDALRAWLAQVQTAYQYDRIFLLDARGREQMSVPQGPAPVASVVSQHALDILSSGQITIHDFYRNEQDHRIYLSILVPIFDERKNDEALGVLSMRVDPESQLYPSIQPWPIPRLTAETLLIRREGNEAEFLNELRFQKNTALTLRASLEDTQMPAVRAVLGKEGIVEGRDYRGTPVLASVRAVPNSPWFLVAKMDLSEVYAPIREQLWVMVAFVGILLAAAGAGQRLIWRQQRLRYYQEQYEAANVLRETELRYRDTLDSMLEGCQIIGADWRYLYLNDAAAAHSRRDKSELLGRTMMECFPGIENTEMFAALKRCLRDRTSRRMENEFASTDGSKGWFELAIQPAPEGVFVLSLDITERKRAEDEIRQLNAELEQRVAQRTAALRESENLLRVVLDSMTANIAILDRHGTIIAINDAWKRFADENAADVQSLTVCVGANYLDVCERAAAELGGEIRTLLDKLRGVLSHSQDAFTYEYACHSPAQQRWFDMHVSPLTHSEGGAVVLHLNVTARKTAEAELRRSRATLQSVFDSLPGLYLVLTPELKIVSASDAYLRATMTTRERLLGLGLFEAFPDNPDDPAATGVSNLRASLNRVLQSGASDTMAIQKYDVRTPAGVFEERYWSPINSPVLGENQRIEYIIHRVEDVTEFVRKMSHTEDDTVELHARMEKMEAEIFHNSQQLQAVNRQLQAANTELEAFSYSVSHDLRAPLRGIDGWSQALLEDCHDQLDETGRQYLGRVRSETQRMGQLIDDMLQLARITRAEMHITSVDVSGIARSLLTRLQEAEPGRTVDIDLQPGLTAEADPRLVEVALSNLLGNAFKFTGKRQNARIEFGQTKANGHSAFFVRDNGAGFDMAYATKLFGAFQRMHKSSDFPGTGVGLAIVKRVIRRHGGQVWVEAAENQGATFYFTLKEAE